MGERNSSLFSKLTLRPKRHLSAAAAAAAATPTASSSSSSRSAASPLPTPEAETPTSISGPADFGLGYSSINHERSSIYSGKRTSQLVSPRPIEFDRYAEPSLIQKQRQPTSSSTRANKLSIVHYDELFAQTVHQVPPTRAVQSTVRARSSSGTSPPTTATIDVPRPQSPFAMIGATSQSLLIRSPSRIASRRCYSSNDSEVVRPSPSNLRAFAQVAAAPDDSFYAVGRGWKKGVYTTKEDAERQIRNFPGPLLQIFRDRAAAEDFVANAGRFTPQQPNQDESDDEFVERTRIFNRLDPNSEFARRRNNNMLVERKEAQRRSRIHIAIHSPNVAAVNSPPLSLRSFISEAAPIAPIDKISFPTLVPLQSMSLLPVRQLASSMAFYSKVLGFTCVSHMSDVQAVMSWSSATVCLRTVDQAPPPPAGNNVTRMSMLRTSSKGALRPDPSAHGRTSLPTMSEEKLDDTELSLPPTPESLCLSCVDPEPLDLPSTSLPLRSTTSTWSGTTVLIECSGTLEAMHSLLSARLNDWRLERTKVAQTSVTKGVQRSLDSAGILSPVQQTPWDAQELHLCDPDGHRIIYTTPLPRGSPGSNLI